MNPENNKPKRTYKYSKLNDVAHVFIDWIGSIQSLVIHTIAFIGSFSLVLFGFELNNILLVLTTILSLEAIYLAIFIQMSLNQASKSLNAVEQDIDEIQEDVEEIQEDVEEIQEDVDEIEKDLDDIQEDVVGIEKDIDEIQEDVEEMEKDTPRTEEEGKAAVDKIELRLVKLLTQLEKIKDEIHNKHV